MGIAQSCCDENRLLTIPDVHTIKFSTDGELTEFVANKNFFTNDCHKQQRSLISKTAYTENQQSLFNLDANPSFKRTSFGSQVTDHEYSFSSSKHYQRIYSSNAHNNSVNLIEIVHKSVSLCSTNANSKNNSRCVSPISKSKYTLIV